MTIKATAAMIANGTTIDVMRVMTGTVCKLVDGLELTGAKWGLAGAEVLQKSYKP